MLLCAFNYFIAVFIMRPASALKVKDPITIAPTAWLLCFQAALQCIVGFVYGIQKEYRVGIFIRFTSA